MKFVPYPYQQYCIDRIISDPAIGLFLDMGLGKTAHHPVGHQGPAVQPVGGFKASHHRAEEGGRGHVDYGGREVGPTEDDAGRASSRYGPAAAESIGNAGRRLRDKPRERDVAGRALQKCVAVRHGGAGREFELQELPEQAVQVPAAGPQQDSQNRGADRHSDPATALKTCGRRFTCWTAVYGCAGRWAHIATGTSFPASETARPSSATTRRRAASR